MGVGTWVHIINSCAVPFESMIYVCTGKHDGLFSACMIDYLVFAVHGWWITDYLLYMDHGLGIYGIN